MEGPWTILELAERAAETLAAAPSANDDGTPAGPGRANGRVRDVPNERLVRWYVTVGLVDPPLSRRGRASGTRATAASASSVAPASSAWISASDRPSA